MSLLPPEPISVINLSAEVYSTLSFRNTLEKIDCGLCQMSLASGQPNDDGPLVETIDGKTVKRDVSNLEPRVSLLTVVIGDWALDLCAQCYKDLRGGDDNVWKG